ncbi:MAG: flagellar biosynthesis protein FlhF [Spirochaetia bacterium]|nr:flagellar biosynthesis protein FlhF [Spirochaetia bacterium]
MQYVKVTGDSHAEALKKLREQYGNEAIIYDERKIKSSNLIGKLFKKQKWEIQAAMKEKQKSMGSLKSKMENLELLLNKTKNYQELNLHSGKEFLKKLEKEDIPFRTDKNKILQKEVLEKYETVEKTKNAEVPIEENKEIDKIWSDISFIKNNIQSLLNHNEKKGIEKEFLNLYDFLLEQELSKSWLKEFMAELRNNIPQKEWKIKNKIYEKAKELLMKRIKINHSLGTKKVVTLIGPTGVGKTTTVAKLAAGLKFKENKKVSLITLDNYRIAATEQLKLYGNIMDIPVHVCKEKDKFNQIISTEKTDIILVDTTGISHNNKEFLQKQFEFFSENEREFEKHLVISASSKPKDIFNTIENFGVFNVDRLIVSKLDETQSFGYLLEAAESWNLPFSFFTMGQRVPDDYMPADKGFLADKILEEFNKNN